MKKQIYCDQIFKRADNLLEELIHKIPTEQFLYYQNKLQTVSEDLNKLLWEKLKLLEMTTRLDLGIALKLVEKFNGEAEKLTSCFEAVDLLKDYYSDVPEADLLKFFKTRLIGQAHGVINGAATLAEAMTLLKNKFAIKFSPQAIESEMASIKQKKLSLSEYGQQINELAAKLAAAHVSKGTFADEAAADAIVQPIAVKTFMNGLRDPKAQFFLKARNPNTLTKAISDALEVNTDDSESVMWMSAGPSRGLQYPPYQYQNNYSRGYQGNRGYRGNRNFHGRSRGYYQNQNQQYQPQMSNSQQGRGYRGNNRGGRYNNNHNNRPHTASVAEQTQEEPRQSTSQQPQNRQPVNRQQNQAEEANLIDLVC